MAKRAKPAPLDLESSAAGRTAVAVVGMHRSGTSLLARILVEFGLDLGAEEDLLGARADNVEGFWENARFVELNDAILQALGGAWDMPPALEPGWESDREVEALVPAARRLIDGFVRERRPWGWKDPRTSLILPFWLALLPELRVVVCLRHPLEVARSLTSRGSASQAFGLRLWETYNAALLAAVEERDHLVTHYESYFHDPEAEVQRVLEYVGIEAAEDQVVRAAARVNELSRHHRAAPGAVPLDGALSGLYEKLCAAAGPVFKDASSSGSPERDVELETPGDDRLPGASSPGDRPAAAPPKYNAFDDSPGSTHRLVVSLVPPGARVLEFGCATGYMSRVLRNEKGCYVVGIEIDAEAADAARLHCDRLIEGDAETLDLGQELGDERFGVALFADVLEHLRDPAAVLRRVRAVLEPDGIVVASIPNVAHESVRLELLGGEFRYRPLGLLDETHLRFFTRSSIQDLFESSGYAIDRWERRRLDAGQTEIGAPPVPPDVREWLAADPESTTYQFVVRATAADASRQLPTARALLREARRELDELRPLRDLVENQRAELEQLRPLRGASEELAALRRAHEARARQMAALQASFAELLTELDDESNELEWRRGVQEEHEKELAWRREITEELDAQLHRLHRSRSFRLTAPFRATMNLLRRAFRSRR